MRAVSNTSPISNLAVIEHLDLLPEQFSEVRIPGAVENELRAFPLIRPALELSLRQGWLKSASVPDTDVVRLLTTGLHAGEAEAIALALELRASLILLDEREARAAASRLGLRVTGVLGILLRAKLRGALPLLKPELEALRAKANFFISPVLERAVLREAGELS